MLMAVPLLIIPVLIYNVIALFVLADAGGAGAQAALAAPWFTIPMASGARWTVNLGDVIVMTAIVLLFFELLKATSSQKVAIVNHSLSMVVFIVCLVEFLLFRAFATSTFFLITLMVLLDVLAGFIVTIITARKDFDFSTDAG